MMQLDEDVLGFLCEGLAAGAGERVRLEELATAFDCAGGRVVEDEAAAFPVEEPEGWSSAVVGLGFFLGG